VPDDGQLVRLRVREIPEEVLLDADDMRLRGLLKDHQGAVANSDVDLAWGDFAAPPMNESSAFESLDQVGQSCRVKDDLVSKFRQPQPLAGRDA
jgi:hypothetical protein